jgi:hypothetical protein
VYYQWGKILKTTDGGINWTIQSSGAQRGLGCIHFPVDAQTGYVVGCDGTILKTTNGGSQWTAEKKDLVRVSDNRLTISPNPFRISTEISYRSTQLGSIGLKIYDVLGRLVRQLDYDAMRLSDQITWTGDDDSGQKLPAGVYFCRLETDEFTTTKKIMKLK